MNPKISIIVPVYNVESILQYSVDSILRQTFTDFEVLLIDDGSKDNSGKLCDEYLHKDSRIKVFHKENGGLSDARNYGIEHATGDFYLFIDSDDVLHKDFCKILIDLQRQYVAEITSTDLVLFYDFSEIAKLDVAEYTPEVNVFKGNDILKEYYLCPTGVQKIYHGLCMKLYKKELFENLRFEKGRLHEDLYITYRLLDLCRTFVFVNLPYYYYYQKNINSITHNYREKNLVDEIDALNNMYSYFLGNNEVLPYLLTFMVNHYTCLIEKTYLLPHSKNVKRIRKELQNFNMENYKNIVDYSKLKACKIIIKTKFYYMYSFLAVFYRLVKHGR